jgi:hypothetical protein
MRSKSCHSDLGRFISNQRSLSTQRDFPENSLFFPDLLMAMTIPASLYIADNGALTRVSSV